MAEFRDGIGFDRRPHDAVKELEGKIGGPPDTHLTSGIHHLDIKLSCRERNLFVFDLLDRWVVAIDLLSRPIDVTSDKRGFSFRECVNGMFEGKSKLVRLSGLGSIFGTKAGGSVGLTDGTRAHDGNLSLQSFRHGFGCSKGVFHRGR